MSPKRRVLMLAVATFAAVAVFLAWHWSRPAHYANFPPTAKGPWVAFGDSLTEGFGAASGQDYPALLSQLLGVKIINLGRSGETTESSLARLDDVVRLNPRVVLVCLGGNDALNGVPRSQTFSHLARLTDRFLETGAFIVLIGVRSASLRDRNAKPFAQLAAEKRVFHIPDILQGVAFKPIYMSDAVHPNDEGYRLIAERLAKYLKPLQSQLDSADESGTTAR